MAEISSINVPTPSGGGSGIPTNWLLIGGGIVGVLAIVVMARKNSSASPSTITPGSSANIAFSSLQNSLLNFQGEYEANTALQMQYLQQLQNLPQYFGNLQQGLQNVYDNLLQGLQNISGSPPPAPGTINTGVQPPIFLGPPVFSDTLNNRSNIGGLGNPGGPPGPTGGGVGVTTGAIFNANSSDGGQLGTNLLHIIGA